MTRRYLFLCPDRTTASGGIAVIYDAVASLRRAGYEAAVLHGRPAAGYPDHPAFPPRLYRPDHLWTLFKHSSWRSKAQRMPNLLQNTLRRGPLPRWNKAPDDVLVVPEFMLDAALETYGDRPIVAFVQNPFSFLEARMRAKKRGFDIRKRVCFFLYVSEICRDALDLLQLDARALVPASMKPDDFPFAQAKDRLITYMPRKRPEEARLIDEALRARGRIGDYRLEALDNLPRAEIARKLGQSRFFLSLQKRESIGFPAAEAMAAGCIVVGYTGLGGREYFDETTGIPVTEDDSFGLVQALEQAVAEYESAPHRLDALRQHAAREIRARYSPEGFDRGLLAAWKEIEARLTPAPRAP